MESTIKEILTAIKGYMQVDARDCRVKMEDGTIQVFVYGRKRMFTTLSEKASSKIANIGMMRKLGYITYRHYVSKELVTVTLCDFN
jgi:hypothetical protein